jgi:hypothetical protein
MPMLACAMAGIYACNSLFPLPFLLKEKEQKFKADIIGPHPQSGRFPAMSAGPARPTRLGFGVPTHSTREENSTNGQHPRPLPSSRA